LSLKFVFSHELRRLYRAYIFNLRDRNSSIIYVRQGENAGILLAAVSDSVFSMILKKSHRESVQVLTN
jgi:hypothetical protein